MAYKPLVFDLTKKAQHEKQAAETAALSAEQETLFPPVAVADLPPPLQAAVAAMGWPGLMPVQARSLPLMLQGHDLIVQSRTGSGKTGAFLLPLFQSLDVTKNLAQALILCPTRELARQIFEEFERMVTSQPEAARLRAVAVYGGTRYGPQLQAFRQGAQVVIGTPGRVLDHLERGTFATDGLRVLVLDEADEMLSMGFYPAMRALKRYLPRERQSHMFSATMPHAVRRVGDEFLRTPTFLALSGGSVRVDAMTHQYVRVDRMDKDRVLARLLELENPESAIIFVNTRREVDYLAQFLRNFGYDADALSSDLSQKDREHVMGRLRAGRLRFLVATDVAARGIDISDLSHVFQYDVPQDKEYYVHRAGRTARAGKSGVAITLASTTEYSALMTIARDYNIEMEELPIPTDEAVAVRVAERTAVLLEERMRGITNLERERLQRFLPLVKQLADEEPEVLANVLDDLYQASLHAPPPEPDAASEPAPADYFYHDDDPAANTDGAPEDGEQKRKKRKKKRGPKPADGDAANAERDGDPSDAEPQDA